MPGRWNSILRGDGSLLADGLRLLRVGLRSGVLQQQSVRGLITGGRLLFAQPLGPGMVHALNAANLGEHLAVVDGSVRLGYARFDALLNQLVHALTDLGLGRRESLVLLSENRWEYLLGFFGAMRGGFLAVHLGHRTTAGELSYALEHSQARAVLFSPACWETVRRVRREKPELRIHWIATDPVPDGSDVHTLGALLEGNPTDFPTGPNRLRVSPSLVYTSGTTGKPKGAVRDFGRMSLPEMIRILDRLPVKSKERHLVVAPLYHSAAQAFAAIGAAAGATLVIRPKFDPEEILHVLVERNIDSVFLVPTMIRRILDLPEEVKDRYRPSLKLRWLISGAAPFPHALRERALEYFGPVVHDFYGTTEAGWVTLVGPQEMRERPNTVGRPLPGTRVLIVDEEGQPLPPGEVGEIYVAHNQVIDEYFRDEAATRASRLGDAQATSDLGVLDEDGYLTVVGRTSDMIISGGENVYPAEIEQALEAHPRVEEAAVVGLPDPDLGERVAAFLIGPSEGDLEAIDAHCRELLAGHKVPRTWRLVSDLPRNETGKVLKGKLREDHTVDAPARG